MHRRQALITLSLGAAGLGVGGRLYAASPGTAKLLIVFLRGGYDCASALVPYASDFYYAARPNLAIPRPSAADGAGALALDADWALAPALRGPLAPLWNERSLAFVPFAGTGDLSRSHFETQDDLELGQPPGGAHRDYRSGFLARLAAELPAARPIAFTDARPLCLAGVGDLPSVAVRGGARAAYDERQRALYTALYAGQPLAGAVDEGLKLRAELNRELATEPRDPARRAPAATRFVAEAPRIGRLLAGDYALGFVDLGGWDTHVNQGAVRGALAANLAGLAEGLAALKAALGADWSRTAVVVVSEFGRTVRENGNRGTDHGHGSVYWLLGGAIRGGRIAGRQTRVSAATLFQDRDYPVLNNYRDVLGGLARRLWGLDAAALDRVFPGSAPLELGLA